MKKILFTLAALLLASTASAQDAGKPFMGVGTRVGLGHVAISATGAADLRGDFAITVPINIAPELRIEPFLGYIQQRENDTVTDIKTWNSTLRLGASVFLLKDVGQQVEMVLGGRLTILREAVGTETPAGSSDDSWMGFGLSAVGGAEYYFSPRFAIGVEAELGFENIEVADTKYTDVFTASYLTAKVFFK